MYQQSFCKPRPYISITLLSPHLHCRDATSRYRGSAGVRKCSIEPPTTHQESWKIGYGGSACSFSSVWHERQEEVIKTCCWHFQQHGFHSYQSALFIRGRLTNPTLVSEMCKGGIAWHKWVSGREAKISKAKRSFKYSSDGLHLTSTVVRPFAGRTGTQLMLDHFQLLMIMEFSFQ